MTTLHNIGPIGWAAAILGGFIVWAVVTGSVASFVAGRLKRTRPTYTNLVVTLPPVPPSDDYAWLDDMPADILTDDEIAHRFERIVGAA